jgi:hypothetical protein
VGYSLDHAGDTYRMWNPKTKGLHNTRDVIWLKRMYYTKQLPTYDVVIESVEPRENEVGGLLEMMLNQVPLRMNKRTPW